MRNSSGNYGNIVLSVDISGDDYSSGKSSVTFGNMSKASGHYSVVSGGYANTTSGRYSTVSGGVKSRAS